MGGCVAGRLRHRSRDLDGVLQFISRRKERDRNPREERERGKDREKQRGRSVGYHNFRAVDSEEVRPTLVCDCFGQERLPAAA